MEDKLLLCFQKYIGVRGCKASDAPCLVNDIPGISNELLDKIAEADSETYYDVFLKALKASVSRLRNDVLQLLLEERNRKRFGSVLYETAEPRVSYSFENETFNKVGAILVCGYSKYVIAEIRGAVVFVQNESVMANIYLYDFETNTNIWEANGMALQKGRNYINIDFSIDANKSRVVMLCIEGDSIELSKMKSNRFTSPANEHEYCECVSNAGSFAFKRHLKDIQKDHNIEWAIYNASFENMPKLESLTVIDDDFVGMDISIDCSIESFLCAYAKHISPALLSLVGAMILTEKLGGYRTNYFAKGNLEFTKEFRQELMNIYRSQLKKTIRVLPIEGSSMCWECEEYGVVSSSLV